jgi:acetyl esterase/lipase
MRHGEDDMRPRLGTAVALAGLIAATAAGAREYEVVTRTDIEYAVREDARLAGDLYLPKGLDKAPVLVAVHGGGWQAGNRAIYKYWGPHLAKNGYAVFAVSYRLSKPGTKSYPAAVYDVKAAVQFVRAKAAELGVDPDRIALMGDSAGAHLATLAALAAGEPQFSSEHQSDPHAAASAAVKAVIGFYGVYDMLAQWEHDQVARPRDQITEKFLGGSPMLIRRAYFDASPLSYATVDKNRTRVLLVYGTADDIVDPQPQSQKFLTALKQAGFFVRTVVIPGGTHFWVADPVEEAGSFGAFAAPRVLRFLEGAL